MRLTAATKWYEIGRVSQSKAAEIAGISHQAFIEALPRFKVTSLQTTPEELAREWAEAQQPTQLARNQIAGQDFIKKARGVKRNLLFDPSVAESKGRRARAGRIQLASPT